MPPCQIPERQRYESSEDYCVKHRMIKSLRSKLETGSDDAPENGCREEDPASWTGEVLRLTRSTNIQILVEQDPFEPDL